MKVDISFIPAELLSEDLTAAASAKLEYPFIRNRLFEDAPEDNSPAARLMKTRNRYRDNYFTFHDNLYEFARNQYENKNYGLSRQSFEYLVGIGSRISKVKEYLIKIYKKEQSNEGLLWIKQQVKKTLSEPDLEPSEYRKHLRLLKVYFGENISKLKRRRGKVKTL